MEYRNVGNTGLRVSEIAYGSWLTFANQVELDAARSIIKKAFDLGINHIDTADVYAGGAAETLLGEILPAFNRRHYVIATKAFWPMSDHPTDRGLSRKHIVDSIHGSLARLKLDYVDIFYCHRFDPEVPLMETLQAVADIIRLGKVLYWGTSEWSAAQIAEAHRLCISNGLPTPVINQPNYSLIVRGIEDSILPCCKALGMGTANFSPLAQGVLSGKYSGGKIPDGSRGGNDKLNMWMKGMISDQDLLARVDKLGVLGKKYGITGAQLAIAWILQKPEISSVIVGASSVEQLEQNAKGSGIKIETADMAEIERLFPRA